MADFLITEYDFENRADVKGLNVSGSLDSASIQSVRDKVDLLIAAKCANIILNFGGLDYINSAGLGVIVESMQKARLLNGKVIISNMSARVSQVVFMCGLDRIMEITDSDQEALEKLT